MRKLAVAALLLIPISAVSARAATSPPSEARCFTPRAGGATSSKTTFERRRALAAMTRPPTARAADFFEPDTIARADTYRRSSNLVNFTWLGVSLLALFVLGYWRARRLGAWAARRTKDKPYRTAALLASVVPLVPFLLTIPLRIGDHQIDRSAGLATDTNAAFAADVAKSLGFALATTVIAVLLFMLCARKLPRAWPLVVATGAAALTFVAVYLLPVVYEPAFNTFTDVGPRTRALVLATAKEEGVTIGDVLVSDASRRTTALNAYVSGVGSTKRVVLYDTLLRTDCAIFRNVVAHELAHEKHHDVLNGTYLSMAGAAAALFVLELLLRRKRVKARLGIETAGDPTVVPFLVFFVAAATFLTLPVVNGLSRMVEARADRTAIRVTDDPRGAIATEVRLAKTNLSDIHPNPLVRWWFFTHPSTLERIQFALDYEWERARCPRGVASATCPKR